MRYIAAVTRFRVMILAGAIDDGAGSHAYHKQLAQRLRDRGHTVEVVCFGHDGSLAGIPVHVIPRTSAGARSILWRVSALADYAHVAWRFRSLPLTSPDIAFCGEHLLLRPVSRRYPAVPLVYFPHAPFVAAEIGEQHLPPATKWLTLGLYKRLQRWALTHADATVRFTEAAAALLRAQYCVHDGGRLVVNPVGVDPAAPREHRRLEGPVRVLSAGRLVPSKNNELTIRALASVTDVPWVLDVLGEGECREPLDRLARTLGLADRIHFHGFQQNLEPWFRQADLLAFPSRIESLGLVMIEAMAHSVPCLAIRADGSDYVNVHHEIVDDGRTGLLADSEAHFTERIGELLRDPAHLTALGDAARDDVAERFTWDRHLDRYDALFERLTSPTGAIETPGQRGS